LNRLRNSLTDYSPTIGILIFAGLYIYATIVYPGGSQVNPSATRFDWINNYWCTLFDKTAVNGQPNPARPFSIAGMFILWISLLIFFFRFSELLSTSAIWKKLIRISATVSLTFASLLFTRLHDFATTAASLTGIITLTGIIWGVSKSNLVFYKITGIICILLLAINNYIYYSGQFIIALPLIQKFTFLAVLLWITGLNHKMMQKNPSE
jgi:hypothetical protein